MLQILLLSLIKDYNSSRKVEKKIYVRVFFQIFVISRSTEILIESNF